MSGKSLRKAQKAKKSQITKLSRSENLHLVQGEHKHQVTHSHTPISADEIQKLQDINPQYVDRLLTILEKSVDTEAKERELFFSAVDKEQENDKLAILKESELKTNAISFATKIIFSFLSVSTVCFFLGYWEIGSFIITVGLVGVLKSMFSKAEDKI